MSKEPGTPRYRLAVDIGGTFVDAVHIDRATGEVAFRKAPTTPRQPWVGVLEAIATLATPLAETDVLIHGTTLGLNAVLERKGAVTGIITNAGFRDIFHIGRGNIPAEHMYDFQYERPPSLVQRRHVVGVRGRLNYRGEVIEELDEKEVRAAARHLVDDLGVTSIAVAFLFSFRNPAHEQRAAAIIRAAYPQITVSVSSEITREHREYERTSTAVLDAYIQPIFHRYIDKLEQGLRARGFDGQFLIMRSGGGAMTSAAARGAPTHTILSGPAGGIVGASFLARLLDRDDLLSLDIGGTSLDACVFERGNAAVVHEAELEHYPFIIPVYDIRTIGAGGGSIAWLDAGLLQVGPQSAGAEPGPICYRRGGTEPTVTDAACVLGYIDPATFLGGAMPLDAEGAQTGVADLVGRPLDLDAVGAAAGVFAVLLARTVGAVRQITVERARDPRTFSLLAFGGAGPMIAPLLAREMAIPQVIVPLAPSAFSAWGMLNADIVEDAAQTDLRILDHVDLDALSTLLTSLGTRVTAALTAQGLDPETIAVYRELELRYAGQEHALSVPVGQELVRDALRKAFDAHHEHRYGHAMDNEVQILNVRVRGVGRVEGVTLPRHERGDGDASRAHLGVRPAYCFARGAMADFGVYRRDRLRPGDRIAGPAIIDEDTSSTVFHSDQALTVDDYGHLIVRMKETSRA